MSQVISIICPNRKFYSRAVAISKRVNAGHILVEDVKTESSSLYSLQVDEDGVSLIESNFASHGPVKVDFVNGSIGHRRRYGGGNGQAIATTTTTTTTIHISAIATTIPTITTTA